MRRKSAGGHEDVTKRRSQKVEELKGKIWQKAGGLQFVFQGLVNTHMFIYMSTCP